MERHMPIEKSTAPAPIRTEIEVSPALLVALGKLRGEHALSNAERFEIAVSQIVGKRLTYAELTGHADDEPF